MIELGSKVKDTVTGFVGVAICRVEYLNGCIQYGIKPPVSKDNKVIEPEYIDEGQLEVVMKRKVTKKKTTRRSGGPSSDAPGGTKDLPRDDYYNKDFDPGNWSP